MSVREAHRALTRETILNAVLDLVAEGRLDELSIPAVATRSGVSVATIYRYFPAKSDLLDAAAAVPAQRARAARPAADPAADPLLAELVTMWGTFAENLDLVRHQIASSAGRDMRTARLAAGRERLADYLAGRGVDPSTPGGQRLTALLLLVTGSLGLVELHDRQHLDLDTAVEHAHWAAEQLIAATVHGGGPPAERSG